jgi:hypothetical protein
LIINKTDGIKLGYGVFLLMTTEISWSGGEMTPRDGGLQIINTRGGGTTEEQLLCSRVDIVVH